MDSLNRPNLDSWLIVRKEGLFCKPGNFYIDPKLPVDYAIITHAHLDHAILGHQHVLATPETLKILDLRFEQPYAAYSQMISYHEEINHNGVSITFLPAGHILGSAQILLAYQGERIIVSGDYKRAFDPTCQPFEVASCDVFISEATFGLPIFKHPPIEQEITKLLDSIEQNPQSSHMIGLYTLGKCQRVIAELRRHGYEDVIYMQPSKFKMCQLYEQLGIKLGQIAAFTVNDLPKTQRGKIFLIAPNSLRDRWVAKFPNPILSMATGWMRVRARAKQEGVMLPLIISDHADWHELTSTINEIHPKQLWVTHGQEDALVYYAEQQGYNATALDIWREEGEGES